MTRPFSIRVYGSPRGVHSDCVETRPVRHVQPVERETGSNGPVHVLVKDGVRLVVPEVVEVRE